MEIYCHPLANGTYYFSGACAHRHRLIDVGPVPLGSAPVREPRVLSYGPFHFIGMYGVYRVHGLHDGGDKWGTSTLQYAR